jgi:adenylosuccinate lyase
MQLQELTAISPIDGRYRSKVQPLSNYFSEFALIKYRIRVEIEYFIALANAGVEQLKDYDPVNNENLRNLYRNLSLADAQKIKNTEQITNHDVKAVEYFIKEKMDTLNLGKVKEFIHFGLTSQDINNTAVPMSLRDAMHDIILPSIEQLCLKIQKMAVEYKAISMLAKTHGQPASPTNLGKEMMVFVERIENQVELLKKIPFSGKFGGATGNFNAHQVAYPTFDWIQFGNQFLQDSLGLGRQQFTTQIEHYDMMAALFDNLKRINTILIDFCRDLWAYISMEYFKQKINANEVGSSAMPHKVNPIDFENAEGNLGMANAFFEHLSAKLPISRLQRDLTDSTVTRNIGVPFAHVLISIQSIEKGMSKLLLNQEAIDRDLENNCMVVAEAIQTILRRESYPNPYEKLKELTRTNEKVTMKKIHAFIETLDVNELIKSELRLIDPSNYAGVTKPF